MIIMPNKKLYILVTLITYMILGPLAPWAPAVAPPAPPLEPAPLVYGPTATGLRDKKGATDRVKCIAHIMGYSPIKNNGTNMSVKVK